MQRTKLHLHLLINLEELKPSFEEAENDNDDLITIKNIKIKKKS